MDTKQHHLKNYFDKCENLKFEFVPIGYFRTYWGISFAINSSAVKGLMAPEDMLYTGTKECLFNAVFQAAANVIFVTISPGIKSITTLLSPYREFFKPLPIIDMY